jgi:hypothetical protein
MEVAVCIVLTVLSSISGLFIFDMQRENICTDEKLMQLAIEQLPLPPVSAAEISIHVPVGFAMPVCPVATIRKTLKRFSGDLNFVDSRNTLSVRFCFVVEIVQPVACPR